MNNKKVNVKKIKEAIEYHGSLEEHIEALHKDKHALENHIKQLKDEVSTLNATKQSLESNISSINAELASTNEKVCAERAKIKQYSYQYDLLLSFLAMLTSSPSVSEATGSLIALFQSLSQNVWYSSKSIKDLRGLFVIAVMGNFLKCFRCTHCGAQFIINKKPEQKLVTRYACPVCHLSFSVSADDSFLKTMISDGQLENVYRTEKVLDENERLKPLERFFEVKCEICEEPILEWTDENIKISVEGYGWAHNQCWRSSQGQLKIVKEAIKKIKGG
ncbi:coiled-coil domain-containing protein [Chloroflexota bacterium]